jgi:D-alanine--poly(phosphoribitol) ligase subunit 2
MGVDEIVAGLKQQLAELSEGKLQATAIEGNGHLFDYGYVDSLSAVMFIAHIEDKYGVQIEDMDLIEKYTTLDAIARHVAASV